MKHTAASIPEGDWDLVHLHCAVGQLFSLFSSDIMAKNWYNSDGYDRTVDGFTHWLMLAEGDTAYEVLSMSS